ncbi:MAG: RluA family pseudouridine synthase, partial [Flavobacteriales bacterium]
LSALPGDPVRPGLVHRLDKDTTGLMVIAKTETALSHLAKQFFEHSVDRSYHTLVWGEPPGEEGSIEGHIGRNLRDRTLMAVFPDDTQGKPALTHFKVLERFGYVTLLECRLETGRTHQIRVHLRHIGHPVFGDVQYGGDRILKGTTFGKYTQFVKNCFKMLPRQALHARSIAFTHPASGKRMEFDSPLPDDVQGVLHKWRQYTNHRVVD